MIIYEQEYTENEQENTLKKDPTAEEVQQIFKNVFNLFKMYGHIELFKSMSQMIFEEKDKERIPVILSDAYLFFKKYEKVYFDDQFSEMIAEAKELDKKHENSDFCRALIFDVMNVLECYYLERKKIRR